MIVVEDITLGIDNRLAGVDVFAVGDAFKVTCGKGNGISVLIADRESDTLGENVFQLAPCQPSEIGFDDLLILIAL